MRLFRAALAVALSYALGVHPAAAQVRAVWVVTPVAPGTPVGQAQVQVSGVGQTIGLTRVPVTPAGTLTSPLTLIPTPLRGVRGKQQGGAQTPAVQFRHSPAAQHSDRRLSAAALAGAKATPAERVAQIQAVASKAAEGIGRAGGTAASEQAGVQFSALTGERLAQPTGSSDAVGTPAEPRVGAAEPRVGAAEPRVGAAETRSWKSALAPRLGKVAEAARPSAEPRVGAAETRVGAAEPAPPAPAPEKRGWLQVFKDPARNKAFWRYVTGYSIFLFGYEMYIVGLPYLISSMTANSLKEHGDSRANNEAAVKELVRSNRSLARIAHWVAQAFSYVTIPLFTKNADRDGPGKWLVRSLFARAAVLALVPALFFATGALSLQASIWTLFGLIAVQSFFQGLSVTTEGAATTRLLGDKSVTPEERTKANSVLTVIAALIMIAGPLMAGQIALIGPVAGKAGVGGAVIYGIYAGAIALTGLVYASIKLFKGKGAASAASGGGDAQAPSSIGGTLKSLWTSIKEGLGIIFKDRLLRTLLLLSMMSALFSDPLVFNVLPEYIEGLVKAHPDSLGGLLSIPGIGWFLKTLAATPMGNFALMLVMASFGSIVATLLMGPVTRLFKRLGFKTEEALTVPFYFIAALEAPLFYLMTHTPSILGAVGLYGLQALSIGFIGVAIQGLYQKNLGDRKSADINKILAANSLIGIAAAIASTFAYGFLLKDIAIETSLMIAAVATAAVAAIRLAAPFLSFTKEQRRPTDPPGLERPGESFRAPPPPPTHALPSTGDHNGPNSIFSTHL